jgi:hypothetical protein
MARQSLATIGVMLWSPESAVTTERATAPRNIIIGNIGGSLFAHVG